LRAVDAGASNTITAGGNVTGTTISNGNSQVSGGGDVSANITGQGDVAVSGNNVSGNFVGNNIVVAAQNSVNANVNATSTVAVHADGPANLSGSSPSVTFDAPSGSASGSFGQVNNVGGGLIDVNGKPQGNTTLSANADNSRVIPSESTIAGNTAAGGISAGARPGPDQGGAVARSTPEDAGFLLDQGRPVELDLAPSNEEKKKD
jgi:hypothetical protein